MEWAHTCWLSSLPSTLPKSRCGEILICTSTALRSKVFVGRAATTAEDDDDEADVDADAGVGGVCVSAAMPPVAWALVV